MSIAAAKDRVPSGVTEESKGFESRWYAAQTRSRHEKSVSEQLRCRDIDFFLPTYESVRRWKNGSHKVQLPLFPGYTFVRIALRDRLNVLKVPGLVRLVGFNGKPIPLQDHEFENLRNAVINGIGAQPHPYLAAGRPVQIARGPLAGLRGTFVRRKGRCKVVISLDLIQRAVSVELHPADLQTIA